MSRPPPRPLRKKWNNQICKEKPICLFSFVLRVILRRRSCSFVDVLPVGLFLIERECSLIEDASNLLEHECSLMEMKAV